MFSTFLPRYSSFLPPESGIIFIVFTMRTYANFDKIQNYILLNFDKYDFTNKAHIPVASSRQKRLDFSSLFCRDEATRTPDPYVPNVVRYQLRYIPSTCFF